jgi:hypothetical protein
MRRAATKGEQITRWVTLGTFVLIVAATAAFVSVAAQQPKSDATKQAAVNPWEPYKFLIGEWVGEESGKPGGGTGGFTFATDLDGNILVRKAFAHFPATKDRAEFTHNDFMVVYPESGGRTRAIYWDNEAHVLNYSAKFSANSDTLIFLGDIVPSQPRFRLSYVKVATDTLNVVFEFAPPGQPNEFKVYLAGKSVKKK